MKKQLQVMAVSLASILSVASAHAGMIEAVNGDKVFIEYGVNNPRTEGYSGGEFLISDREDSKDYRYIGFCLELKEMLMPYDYGSGNYRIDVDPEVGVTDFAENDVTSGYAERRDYLSNATKWLMNQYVTNYNSFYDTYKGSASDYVQFAELVQNAIWFFEDEIETDNSLVTAATSLFTDVAGAKSYRADFLTSVKVLNIVTDPATGVGVSRQSLVVAATPEPATMLLLGTGLAGLVGVVRSRRNKEA